MPFFPIVVLWFFWGLLKDYSILPGANQEKLSQLFDKFIERVPVWNDHCQAKQSLFLVCRHVTIFRILPLPPAVKSEKNRLE
jgi:hypothetical protein